MVPNLLAVNERELLIETIGATQELSSEADSIQLEVEQLREMAKQHGSILRTLAEAITSVRRSERLMGTTFLNIFGIGPAWTCCILGFFVPIFFLIGSSYMCSPFRHRQVAGLMNMVVFTFMAIEHVVIYATLDGPYSWLVFVYIFMGWWTMGVCVCIFTLLVRSVGKNIRNTKL